jgi:hypothetical protein
MRFLVIVPGNEQSERGELPPPELFEAMSKYNEELVRAGVMLAAEGLTPTSKGAKVRFESGRRTVIDGPFTETKELIAGFWLLECKSLEECLEWVKRAPLDGGVEIEVRPVAQLDEMGDAVPEQVKASEKRLRAENERKLYPSH